MFTVKLYRDGGFIRILAADNISIRDEDEPGYLKGITLHQRNSADDQIVWVGTRTEITKWADERRVYLSAIIENAAGKTTQILHTAPVPADVMLAPLDDNRRAA